MHTITQTHSARSVRSRALPSPHAVVPLVAAACARREVEGRARRRPVETGMARPLRPSVGCGLPLRPWCRRRPPPRLRTSRLRVLPVGRPRSRSPLLRQDRLLPRFVRCVAYPQRHGCAWDLRGVAQAATVLAAQAQAAPAAAEQVSPVHRFGPRRIRGVVFRSYLRRPHLRPRRTSAPLTLRNTSISNSCYL